MPCLYVAYGQADWTGAAEPWSFIKFGITGADGPRQRLVEHRKNNPFRRRIQINSVVHFVTNDHLDVKRVEAETKRHMRSTGLLSHQRPNTSGEWLVGGPNAALGNVGQVLAVISGAAGIAVANKLRARAWIASCAEAHTFADDGWWLGQGKASTAFDVDERARVQAGDFQVAL